MDTAGHQVRRGARDRLRRQRSGVSGRLDRPAIRCRWPGGLRRRANGPYPEPLCVVMPSGFSRPHLASCKGSRRAPTSRRIGARLLSVCLSVSFGTIGTLSVRPTYRWRSHPRYGNRAGVRQGPPGSFRRVDHGQVPRARRVDLKAVHAAASPLVAFGIAGSAAPRQGRRLGQRP